MITAASKDASPAMPSWKQLSKDIPRVKVTCVAESLILSAITVSLSLCHGAECKGEFETVP
jgi:hypothetical protein